jgi:hypothetical protein
VSSSVCTLFEGNYHYGVGSLANSLYAQGFRGTIYAGYRGELPPWATAAARSDHTTEFSPAEGLVLRFIPLATKSHLTNIKPDFMLSLWQEHCPEATSLFYFDPDITVICRWSFFEEWVQAGVALCADMNPAMPPNHPLRRAWKQFYQPRGIAFRREPDLYFNGGFIGLQREQAEFLQCWQRLQELMAPEIGGLDRVNLHDRTYLFHKTDQDALNVAAMTSESLISPVGQDGMDFQQGGGGYIMSHAYSSQKPWKKKFLRVFFQRGWGPSRADRTFFRHVESPIRLYPPATLAGLRVVVLTASLLGRFLGKQ